MLNCDILKTTSLVQQISVRNRRKLQGKNLLNSKYVKNNRKVFSLTNLDGKKINTLVIKIQLF